MSEKIQIEPELWDLIPEYLERRHADVVTLREALEREDLETLEQIGHRLRGSGASYGFARISELGRLLEHAGAEGDTQIAGAQIDALASHLEVLEPVRG